MLHSLPVFRNLAFNVPRILPILKVHYFPLFERSSYREQLRHIQICLVPRQCPPAMLESYLSHYSYIYIAKMCPRRSRRPNPQVLVWGATAHIRFPRQVMKHFNNRVRKNKKGSKYALTVVRTKISGNVAKVLS